MKYLIVMVLLVSTLFADDTIEKCTDYYVKGIEAYESDKYAQAVQFFESCTNEGVNSWVLYYNLGNAWYRQAKLGKAILYYEKSLLLNPGEPDVEANLEFARALIQDKQEEVLTGAGILTKWYRYMNMNTSHLVVIALLFILFVTIAAVFLIRGPARFTLYPVIIGTVFLLVIVGVSISFRMYQINTLSHGVLLTDGTSVLSEPRKSSEILFEIHEGTTFEILETNDGWLSINLGTGKMGYIQNAGVGVIH
ncbi:MAG: tetratricopeptide repeat protein [Fibrobacterales bacterium]